jgi:hypothetical protein
MQMVGETERMACARSSNAVVAFDFHERGELRALRLSDS